MIVTEKIADDISRIFASVGQGSAVQAAGSQFRLHGASVRPEGQGFRASLPGEPASVRMPVIEDIPAVSDLHHAPVIVGAVCGGFLRGLIGINMQVAVAYQDASVMEFSAGTVRCRPAEFMHDFGRIDEPVFPVFLPDGRRLKIGVSFKLRSFAVAASRYDDLRRFRHREHIRTEYSEHGTVAGAVTASAETGIEVSFISFRQHARIKLGLVAFLFPKSCAVRIMDVSEKFIAPRRPVAYGDRYDADLVENIIKIVSSVRPDSDVRGIEAHMAVFIERIGFFRVDDAFISPGGRLIYRRGPAYVVAHAECFAVIQVMGAIDIDPVPEHIGLPVRDILPGRKIGIQALALSEPGSFFLRHGA